MKLVVMEITKTKAPGVFVFFCSFCFNSGKSGIVTLNIGGVGAKMENLERNLCKKVFVLSKHTLAQKPVFLYSKHGTSFIFAYDVYASMK